MSRRTNVLTALLLGLLCQGLAHAEANDPPDTFSLRLSKALAPERFFMRAGAIAVKIKSKSGDTYDVTGPVVTKAELQSLVDDGGAAITQSILIRDPVGGSARDGTRGNAPTVATSIGTALSRPSGNTSVSEIVRQMTSLEITELGTPAGIKAEAQESASTGGLSLGYYLSDDYTWLVEAYVLAKPIETGVVARGQSRYREDENTNVYLRPFGLEGQQIVSTNLLPPTVMFGRYWGAKDARVRLYTGAMAMYAIFYDTKVTDSLNSFVGGTVPGATTVSLKNAFGAGPMVGAKLKLNDNWHVSLNVGSVKLKTVGTLTTRNSFFNKNTGAIQEFGRSLAEGPDGGSISDVLQTAENLYAPGAQGNPLTILSQAEMAKLGGPTSVAMGAIAYKRGLCTASSCDLGTYVRKTDVTLQNTIFMLSVGRNF